MQYKTQKEAILSHLKKKSYITSIEAFKKYGVTRLSAIIFNLREEGHIIKTQNCSTKNRYGNVVNYANYILEEE